MLTNTDTDGRYIVHSYNATIIVELNISAGVWTHYFNFHCMLLEFERCGLLDELQI